MNDSLECELVAMVIELCDIKDINSEEVALNVPIVGPESPLGLDSIDAIEVVVAVQINYNVRIGGEDTSREVLQSFTALADYIRQNRLEAV